MRKFYFQFLSCLLVLFLSVSLPVVACGENATETISEEQKLKAVLDASEKLDFLDALDYRILGEKFLMRDKCEEALDCFRRAQKIHEHEEFEGKTKIIIQDLLLQSDALACLGKTREAKEVLHKVTLLQMKSGLSPIQASE
jgi:hypothetical protein